MVPAATTGTFPFFVGTSPAGETKPFAAEEARWEISPHGVWLYGRDVVRGKKSAKGATLDLALASDTEAGTLFAVYEFLENSLGVKWIEPGAAGVTYRAQKSFALVPGKGAWVPQLVQRHMRTAYKEALRERALADYYGAWKKANARETFLRPNDLCQDTGLPLGFEQHMFEKYRMADRVLSLRGTDYDTCWGFWPVSGNTDYIMARGFYRPERTFEEWDEEYCGTYGEAKSDIAAYYGYWRQVWNRRVMGNLGRINAMTENLKLLRNKMANLADLLYDEKDFDQTDAFLSSALRQNLTPGERNRVETLALANRHNRLTFRATAANRVGSTASEISRKEATQTLYDFRRRHRLDLNIHWELLFYLENAFEDNAGFERLLGTETKKMRARRLETDAQIAIARHGDEKPLR
ncbi:MAG: hypothetical protein EXS37_14940 [Opitutus sp.]|nr:hypothetical protein [Opitutus sp.]